MPRTKTKTLTDAEFRLMNILWDRGPSTVSEVTQSLEAPRLAYNSVLTTLRILEQKGVVTRERQGRAHVYAPRIARGEARRQAVRHLVERFFDNSPELLVQNLLDDEGWDPAHLADLKRQLSESRDRPGARSISSKRKRGPRGGLG